MSAPTAALLLAGGAAGLLLAAVLVLGRMNPAYRQMRHTISELGSTGTVHAALVAWAVFAPVGVLLLAVAYLLQARAAPVALLALCMAVGYLGAALFPCDPGSPLAGSWRQNVHNIAGAVEYAGGAIALMRIGEAAGAPFPFLAAVAGAGAIGLSIAPLVSLRGFMQRVAEACLFGGLVLAILRL